MLFETRLFVKTTTNRLSSLTELDLFECSSLASLPSEIGRLVEQGCRVVGCDDQVKAAREAYNHLVLAALADALYHALPDSDAARLVAEFFSEVRPPPPPARRVREAAQPPAAKRRRRHDRPQ